jgi:CRP-like cAMP-binding protein
MRSSAGKPIRLPITIDTPCIRDRRDHAESEASAGANASGNRQQGGPGVSGHEADNLLLAALSEDEFWQIRPHLSRVLLPARQHLSASNHPIDHVYFIQSGIVSVVAQMSDGRRIEVGILGREGVTGLPLILGSGQGPNQEFVQVPGKALAMPAREFRRALKTLPQFHAMLLRYAYVFMTQISQSMISAGCDQIGPRLARRLLMCHDRIAKPALPLTHEFLAIMLSVRRPGVTDAIHKLEESRFIKAERGQITVLNRPGLEKLAGPSYGLAEQEYRRLISA